MCGRYVEVSSPRKLAPLFEASIAPEVENWQASYNVAPTRDVLGVAVEHKTVERVIHLFRWGLVPSWAKDISAGSRRFNARAETVATSPSYRSSFASRRLIMPADYFYEWSHVPADKRKPYVFRRADRRPMAFAGLYAFWRDRSAGENAPWLSSCTIITTDSGPDLGAIHNRMPVILEAENWDLWLDPEFSDRGELEAMLVPSPAGTLVKHPVGRAVGRSTAEGPQLIEELVG